MFTFVLPFRRYVFIIMGLEYQYIDFLYCHLSITGYLTGPAAAGDHDEPIFCTVNSKWPRTERQGRLEPCTLVLLIELEARQTGARRQSGTKA